MLTPVPSSAATREPERGLSWLAAWASQSPGRRQRRAETAIFDESRQNESEDRSQCRPAKAPLQPASLTDARNAEDGASGQQAQ